MPRRRSLAAAPFRLHAETLECRRMLAVMQAGDFNADGRFDAADYTVWRDSYGQATSPFTKGDATGDGQVDDSDLNLWRDRYGDRYLVGGTLVVNDLGHEDDGDIFNDVTTLREAINYANEHAEADRVEFDPSLSGGKIVVGEEFGGFGAAAYAQIQSALTIDASILAEGITLDLGEHTAAFNIREAGGGGAYDVTLIGLTIANGWQRQWWGGGAIYSETTGALTLIDTTLTNHRGRYGGAINALGAVRLEGVTIDGAYAGDRLPVTPAAGTEIGGSAVLAQGDITLINTRLTNVGVNANGDVRPGGAVAAFRGSWFNGSLSVGPQPSVTLIDSTVTNALAGGVVGLGDVSIVRSTLDTGGYYGVLKTGSQFDGQLTLTDTTVRGFTSEIGFPLFGFSDAQSFYSNRVAAGAASVGDAALVRTRVEGNGLSTDASTLGGGVVARGRVRLTDSQVVGNRAGVGGGVYSLGEIDFDHPDQVVVRVEGSLIADNSTHEGGAAIHAYGSVLVDQSSISGNEVTFDQYLGGDDYSNNRYGSIVVPGASNPYPQSVLVRDSVIARNRGPAGTPAVYDSPYLFVSIVDSHVIDNDSDGVAADEVIDSVVARNTGVGVVGIREYDGSSLDVKGSMVSGNRSGGVRGVLVEVVDSTVRGNTFTPVSAETFLNGAAGVHGGTVLVYRSLVEDNHSTSRADRSAAGGVGGWGVTVVESTVRGNTVTTDPLGPYRAAGAGILANEARLYGSTVNGNTSTGALALGAVSAETVIAVNSTVSGNRAVGTQASGGGVYTDRLFALHSTIADNQAIGQDAAGGGATATQVYDLEGVIVAGNTATAGASDLLGVGGTVVASLIEDPDGAGLESATVWHSFTGLDPRLGPLANNGGPTETHALLLGSPAIDVGNPTRVSVIAGIPENPFDQWSHYPGLHDQRGEPFDRVVDGGSGEVRIDIGAYELHPPDPPTEPIALGAPALNMTSGESAIGDRERLSATPLRADFAIDRALLLIDLEVADAAGEPDATASPSESLDSEESAIDEVLAAL